jgi:hypothetical protein
MTEEKNMTAKSCENSISNNKYLHHQVTNEHKKIWDFTPTVKFTIHNDQRALSLMTLSDRRDRTLIFLIHFFSISYSLTNITLDTKKSIAAARFLHKVVLLSLFVPF